MPIPSLTTSGVLPPGIHAATLAEVQSRFGSGSDVRAELYAKLCELVTLVRTFDLFTSIVLDGSFVTDKPVPEDIDAVLILPWDALARLAQHPRYEELENSVVKDVFKVDLFIDPDHQGMATFFQQLKTEEALERGLAPRHWRGVVEVRL